MVLELQVCLSSSNQCFYVPAIHANDHVAVVDDLVDVVRLLVTRRVVEANLSEVFQSQVTRCTVEKGQSTALQGWHIRDAFLE